MPSAVQPSSQKDLIYLSDEQKKVTVNWKLRRVEKSDFFEIITVPVHIVDNHYDAREESNTLQHEIAPLCRLVKEYLAGSQRKGDAILQLILPLRRGFGARGNAFRDQLNVYGSSLGYLDHSEFAKEYQPPTQQMAATLADIIPFSVCTVLVDPSLTNQSGIQFKLFEIVSFPWIMQEQPEWKTCALVHGRDSIEAFQPIGETAHDLGIKLIVLDSPGHWLLTSPQYRNLYEEFEPIDMTIDEDFPRRIANAVQTVATRRGRIDGICTVSDRCLLPVSKAATALNMPTGPPYSFATAIDKAASRQLCADEGISFLSVRQPAELRNHLKAGTFHAQYPLIVKPSTGWSSEHVFRVKDEAELCLAAERVATRRNTKILIEPFVDGPEVDANFVLCDGELLFFEASDDFPSPADGPGAGMESNFFETANVLPSALPQVEVDRIRDRLYRLLLDMGFRTGVFHLEARVIDSSMEFAAGQDGILDLRPRFVTEQQPRDGSNRAKCFLIEVNPRPPGFQSVYATRLMYGVDYFALHLLAAVGDNARIRGLGQSFWDRIPIVFPSSVGGPEKGFWCSIVFITGNKGGICDSTDPVSDLLARSPSLKPFISTGMSFFKKGDEIPHATPERLVFLGFFLVLSWSARTDIIDVAQQIRKEFRMAII
ncbi:hypothetical protein PMG11_05798 [Penicillium brasilianum]|uniref:ATP-grasp domain-containing protein n=1 Tax=Penicillium brasilianum TaxID=104259 RepID=A0A0F7TMJ3_PENBI|nr:hypothetical protein PMG11_05798 [Penicillium brasilianum]